MNKATQILLHVFLVGAGTGSSAFAHEGSGPFDHIHVGAAVIVPFVLWVMTVLIIFSLAAMRFNDGKRVSRKVRPQNLGDE